MEPSQWNQQPHTSLAFLIPSREGLPSKTQSDTAQISRQDPQTPPSNAANISSAHPSTSIASNTYLRLGRPEGQPTMKSPNATGHLAAEKASPSPNSSSINKKKRGGRQQNDPLLKPITLKVGEEEIVLDVQIPDNDMQYQGGSSISQELQVRGNIIISENRDKLQTAKSARTKRKVEIMEPPSEAPPQTENSTTQQEEHKKGPKRIAVWPQKPPGKKRGRAMGSKLDDSNLDEAAKLKRQKNAEAGNVRFFSTYQSSVHLFFFFCFFCSFRAI
jgi:hypothetical protein